MKMIAEAWALLVAIFTQAPPGLWAAIAGTVISWRVTQYAKFLLPLTMPERIRRITSQAIAFAIGFAAALAIWPTKEGAVLAVCVGIWSPASFWLFMRAIGTRWPDVRDKLSADIRDEPDPSP